MGRGAISVPAFSLSPHLQSCTPKGAPHFQPEEVRIDGGGVTFIDVSWDDPKGAECEGTYYQVVLNGSPHIRKLKKTEQRVEKISPGEYQVCGKSSIESMFMMMMCTRSQSRQ